MSKQLFSIFAKAKRPREDAFDRDIAPKLAKDRYKRQVDIASHTLRRAREKLEAELGDGESVPENQALAEEYDRRVRMIAKGDELVDSCAQLLDRWVDRIKEDDETAQQSREALQAAIGDAFPKLQSKLAEIEVSQRTEVGRLTAENRDLVEQNLELKDAASKSLVAGEISAQLQAFLESRLSAPPVDPAASAEAAKEIRDLTAKKLRLQAKIERDLEAYESSLKVRNDKIASQSKEKKELKEKLATTEKEVREFEAGLQKLNQDLKANELKIANLEEDLLKQTDRATKESARACRLDSDFETKLSEKQTRISELEAAANAPRLANQEQVKVKREIQQQLDLMIQSRESANRKCENLQVELKQLTEERSLLHGRLEKLDKEVTRVREEHEEAIQGLIEALEFLEREKQSADGLLEEANDTVIGRDRENDQLRVSEKRFQQQVKTLGSSLATETSLKGQLMQQNAELQALVEAGTKSLQKKEKEWRGIGEKLGDEIKKLLQSVHDLEAEKGEFERTRQSLQKEIDRLKPMEIEATRLQPFETQATTLAEEKVSLKNEVSNLRPFKDTANTLDGENESLVEKNQQLQNQVDRLAPFESTITTLEQEKTSWTENQPSINKRLPGTRRIETSKPKPTDLCHSKRKSQNSTKQSNV